MSKILITRSLIQGRQFIDDFCDAYGHEYEHRFAFEPALEIVQTKPHIDYDLYDAFLATSQNALYFDLPSKPLFHVGKDGVDTVQDLIDFVWREGRAFKYLYLRGRDVRVDLKSELSSSGFDVDEVVVYEARAAHSLTQSLVDSLERDDIGAVTFFSARTAEIFMKLSQEKALLRRLNNIKVLCISEAVLRCVHTEFFKDVRVARKPNARGMMDLIKECIDEQF